MVKTAEELRRTLGHIDGRGYKAYKDIEGIYSFREYTVHIDHVQADPFASPSRVRVQLSQGLAGFPQDTYSSKSRETALRDFLTRVFAQAAKRHTKGNRGTGNSGVIAMDIPRQEVLERTSVFINDKNLEARLVMGLPAFGRSVAGKHAQAMFFSELPQIVRASLLFRSLDKEALYRHLQVVEDADFLRQRLESLGLVAFVADGAILPRASGIDPRPLAGDQVVPFKSPESLRVEVKLPNSGAVTGMGIPRGVTLVVGGGYHGKSTLLRALELGIYNHIPGDGREYVVSNPHTIKIRAEDGRRIEKADISPFIANLPFGQDTRKFSSEDASGSTSQAANIIESLELGAQVLLIDEDTSATNFMIRDHRMQELVAKDKEPITPFIDKVGQLYSEYGVSTILVIGGSGDYFDVADLVICMKDYQPYQVTEQARAIAEKYRAERKPEGGPHFGTISERIPLAHSFDASKGRREVKISPKGLQSIAFGTHTIDLGAVEQLTDPSQTRAIGDAIYYATSYMDGKRTLREIVNAVLADIKAKGLDALSPRPVGDYAQFRGLELGAAINRLRTLAVQIRNASGNA
jgi:predicted ABC-class ATPase